MASCWKVSDRGRNENMVIFSLKTSASTILLVLKLLVTWRIIQTFEMKTSHSTILLVLKLLVAWRIIQTLERQKLIRQKKWLRLELIDKDTWYFGAKMAWSKHEWNVWINRKQFNTNTHTKKNKKNTCYLIIQYML